jgi:hypothetical protein
VVELTMPLVFDFLLASCERGSGVKTRPLSPTLARSLATSQQQPWKRVETIATRKEKINVDYYHS